MRKSLLSRITATVITFSMLLTLMPVALATGGSEGTSASGISVTAAGPSGVVIQDEIGEPVPAPDLFAVEEESPVTAEIARDYAQTVPVTLKNTTDTDLSFYMTVNNPNEDLSMNFVDTGYSEDTSILLPAGETATASLAIFAQEANASSYDNITLYCHVIGYETTTARTLELTVAGEGLSLKHEISTLENGDIQVTLTNTGADINSLKVTSDDTLAPYAFFPTMITNYELNSNATVTFTVSPGGNLSGSVSGNLIAKGNGGTYSIPITLTAPQAYKEVSGRTLLQENNELADVQITNVGLDGSNNITYQLACSGGSKSLPVSLNITVREITSEDIIEDTGDADSRIDGILMGETVIEGNKITLSFSYLDYLDDSISLMDVDDVNALLVEYGIEIDLSDSGINAADFAEKFDAAVANSSRLAHIDNLPNLPSGIRDQYTAALQMSLLLEILEQDTAGDYSALKAELSKKLKEVYPEENDPIAYLRETLERLESSLETIITRKPEYASFQDAIDEDSSKKVIDQIKEDEAEHPSDYSVISVEEDGHQCTNRGSITSSFYAKDTYSLGASLSLFADDTVTAADRGVKVYYSGRIVSEDQYVNFEEINYDLYLNGVKFGVSANSGLSEMNIIELDPSLVLMNQSNTFTRDYDVNPGTHFINTDNRFMIVYPSDAVLQVTDGDQVAQAQPDFDVYKKNIFVLDKDGNYVDEPIAGQNTIHVSISNRGAHGGYFKLSITDGNGNQLLDDSEAQAYHYLPAFYAQTLTLEDVTLAAGDNQITVTITDCSGRTKETETANNTATMTITARDRQVPTVAALLPSGEVENSTVTLKAALTNYSDVQSVEFYLDGSRIGTVSGSKSEYSLFRSYIAPGSHTFYVAVTYLTGNTSSTVTKTLTSDSVSFRVAGTSPWAEVQMPTGVNAEDVSVALVQYVEEFQGYTTVYMNAQLDSDSDGVSLYVSENEDPEGNILLVYDAAAEKLYAGTVGEQGVKIIPTADRKVTLTDATFYSSYSELDVYVGGNYYPIAVTAGTTEVQLPALIIDIYDAYLKVNVLNRAMWVDMGSIDLREANVSYTVADNLLIYSFTRPDDFSRSASTYYIYTYQNGSSTSTRTLYGSSITSDNILTAYWDKNNLYNAPIESWIYAYSSYPYGDDQAFVMLVDTDDYQADMNIGDQTASVLSFTADEPSKLEVTSVTLCNNISAMSSTINLSNTSNKTIRCTPGTYNITVSFIYDGNAYSTEKTVDLTSSKELNLSTSDLNAKFEISWADSLGQTADITLCSKDEDSGTLSFLDRTSGDEISVVPGSYAVTVNIRNNVGSSYSYYEFDCATQTAVKDQTTKIEIGDALIGAMEFYYGSDTTYMAGETVAMRLTGLADSTGNALQYSYSDPVDGYVLFTPVNGEGDTITVPVTLSRLTNIFTVKMPQTAGTYNLNFSTSLDTETSYYVIQSSAGTGGTISPSGTVPIAPGASQTFTISADPGYRIHTVTVDGVDVGAVASYTFSDVAENHTISASFVSSAADYVIQSSAGIGGTISPSGEVPVTPGDSQTFMISPNFGYWIRAVIVDGVNAGAVTSYTFNDVAENHTISASFIPLSSGSNSDNNASTTYAISVPASTNNGSVTVSPTRAAEGDTVTITVQPDEGYELNVLTVKDSMGNALVLTPKSETQYTFIMPSSSVKVEGTFKAIDPSTGPWSNPYTDVSENAWYYDAVKYATENGLMNGYGNGIFAPENTLSRAMLAQILYNKEGKPAVTHSGIFTDVASGIWYTDAVTWAAAKKIVTGYGDSSFGPNNPITREQLAVMLWRYAGEPSVAGRTLDFNDVNKVSPWALEALQWAVQNSIINGKGNGILDPGGQAKRAEVAQMLMNFLSN